MSIYIRKSDPMQVIDWGNTLEMWSAPLPDVLDSSGLLFSLTFSWRYYVHKFDLNSTEFSEQPSFDCLNSQSLVSSAIRESDG